MAGGDGADEGDRLELLAAIKAHSQHLTTEGGACGGSSDDVAAGLGGGGGWSGEDWRRAFQQLFLAQKPAPTEGCAGGQDDLLFFVRPESSQNTRRGAGDGAGEGSQRHGGTSWATMGYNTVRRLAVGVRAGEGAENDRVFVRRWRPDIPDDIGVVDWRETLFLNVIAHTSFLLTIAVSSRRAIAEATSGGGGGGGGGGSGGSGGGLHQPPRPISRTVKAVYATPSRATVSLSTLGGGGGGGGGGGAGAGGKASSHDPTYPDLYFTVDDFAEAFGDTVISDPDHCLCVHLSATDSVAFHNASNAGAARGGIDGGGGGGGAGMSGAGGGEAATEAAAGAAGTDEKVGTLVSGERRRRRRVTLFSGFVSYEQLNDAFLSAHRSGGGTAMSTLSAMSSRLGGGGVVLAAERIVMAGPGGRGQAEVAVFESPPAAASGLSSGGSGGSDDGRNGGCSGGGGGGGGGLTRRGDLGAALSAGSAAVRRMVRSGSGGGGGGGEVALKLQCCIMSVSVRWDHLAHDILFKPPSLPQHGAPS